MKCSVVIPLYNEAESLNILHEKIISNLSDLCKDYEIIFVDDGSTDNSFEVLKKIQEKSNKTKIIQFRRNLGKSAALAEGFKYAQFDTVITMDADLQDDPSEIKNLLIKINEGFDLVSGWKKDRQDPKDKTIPSLLFNKTVSFFSGLKLHDYNCGLKAYRLEVVKELKLYGELHRFIPVLAHNLGFKVTEIPVTHFPRKYGFSKYGWTRIPKGLIDFMTILFLTNYGRRPLHLFGGFGLILTIIGFIFGIYLTILRVSGEKIGERPLLFLTMLLIVSGLQFIFTGLLAEMILHISPLPKSHLKTMQGFDEKNI